ncbi:MAG: two-component system response regulator OmpR [Burkholderiales bacterium]|jgi:DNA-binding response OmpR family regulator|nr:two-component system response regulator OmpR [Burkholderiales bacterium]
MSENERILVVDDDARLRDLLARYLGENGFRVRSAQDAASMEIERRREPVDLLVLDLMLPGEDGLSICRRLRADNEQLPIIMLTARGEEVDRIVGLEMGADDYLPKPFNPRELLARIRAVLRRKGGAPGGSAAPLQGGKVAFGPFLLDLATRQLTRDGEPLPLTSGEFSVLKVLVEHARRPLSRDQLMELARGREHEAFDRAIDVQISRLRKLIEDSAGQPRYIQTVWGFGYVFVPDGERSA